jgi:alkylation response protein AidB-like acyl-CoA dehydrogenase
MKLQQLEPTTTAGRKFVELAEMHAAEAATRAAEHDRDGTFPVEAVEAMKASGFVAGPIPEEFGGMGVMTVSEVGVAVNRLGRTDASLAIAINMHLVTCLIATRLLRGAREAGDAEQIAVLEGFMQLLGARMIAMANVTEAGTDVRHPMTEAKPVDGGWRIDGRKIFGTLSPVADIILVDARHQRDDGTWGRARAIVTRGTPGMQVMDNWDALGMRGSGSHDIVYDNCFVPDAFLLPSDAWGDVSEDFLIVGSAGQVGLVATFLGIAETARDYVANMLQTRTKQPSGKVIASRSGIQHGMAELEIALATCRAHIAENHARMDALLVDRPVASVTEDELHELTARAQITKLVSQRAAIDVVDKALELSGGAGYFSTSPLSRMYRDVRAGPFMQPFSPNEAYEYIGQVALSQPLDIDH